MDIVTRKQINILIQLAEADRDFAVAEREMIYQLARDKNFPVEEVDQLILHPEPIDSLGALSPNQKFEYLYSCISLILADRKVVDTELKFAKNIAIKLGFRQNVVDFLLEEINNSEKSTLRKTALESYV